MLRMEDEHFCFAVLEPEQQTISLKIKALAAMASFSQ